jgi:hypothetical protein
MEIEARRQADKKVEALESRLDNMQQLLEKLLQQQQNPSSTPNGSNNSPHVVILLYYTFIFNAVIVPQLSFFIRICRVDLVLWNN